MVRSVNLLAIVSGLGLVTFFIACSDSSQERRSDFNQPAYQTAQMHGQSKIEDGRVEEPPLLHKMSDRSISIAKSPVSQPSVSNAKGNEKPPADNVALISQKRIIIRTVDMSLEVSDLPSQFDEVASLAVEFGGWIVSSDKSSKHTAFISMRVPYERLDETILRLRKMAKEVNSEVTSSTDVTDEYVDLTARLQNMQATEKALLGMLDQAKKIEDALKVQSELTRIQEEIERFKGRIKFLEQTSAFSLVNVYLELTPIVIFVDAGQDQTLTVGEVARFRATFRPPIDTQEVWFTWDFGDGSLPVTSDRTAPTANEGERVTATVTHVYTDDQDSPYIVTIQMTVTGKAGLGKGNDTMIATVSRVPVVEVFAGADEIVEEDEEIKLSASFTRPAGLRNLRFIWDFGDGSVPLTGPIDSALKQVPATHIYSDHRPFSYTGTFTILAEADAGQIMVSDTLNILVTESNPWVISGWSFNDTAKLGIRVLSAVGIGLAYFFIFAGIFSPVWIAVGLLYLFLRRRIRRRSS